MKEKTKKNTEKSGGDALETAESLTEAITEAMEKPTKELAQDITLESIDIVTVAEKVLEKADELLDELIVDTQSFKQITAALKDLNDIITRNEEDKIKEIEILLHAGPEEWNG